MEQNNIVQDYKIKVKASDILKKFKHQEDRFNFCRERSNLIFLFFRCISTKRTLF